MTGVVWCSDEWEGILKCMALRDGSLREPRTRLCLVPRPLAWDQWQSHCPRQRLGSLMRIEKVVIRLIEELYEDLWRWEAVGKSQRDAGDRAA